MRNMLRNAWEVGVHRLAMQRRVCVRLLKRMLTIRRAMTITALAAVVITVAVEAIVMEVAVVAVVVPGEVGIMTNITIIINRPPPDDDDNHRPITTTVITPIMTVYRHLRHILTNAEKCPVLPIPHP